MKLGILKSTGEVVDDRQSGDPPDYVIKENIAKRLKINPEVIEVIKVPLKSYTEKLMDNIFGLVERCYLILLQ